ncbi:alanine racemase [Ahrensia marina]|uniref:Ornithine decarboxylase n=1 Tax=Ahrensia marina TaxID=1514904 RepID=A0A0M9GN09_9HYPH|nr:alanine racemase [Ahrensia marina]KPB01727.1 ornithine decarboxylase [Ahrensia marina]
MDRYLDGTEAALALRPDQPVYCFRPHVLAEDAKRFQSLFPGQTAYAVKTNGEPMVIKTLVEAGVTAFDVASPAEFEIVRKYSPDAEMLYMHPVKAQSDIRLALEEYKIRTLVVDHEDEIVKVLRVCRAIDIDHTQVTVFVRLQTKGHAAYELSKKFGAAPNHAVELLKRLHRIGFKTGICFHVGSQIEDADTYEKAIASAYWVRTRANVPLVGLDVGGGFPADYGRDPKKSNKFTLGLDALMQSIDGAVKEYDFDDIPLVAEPGRVICARAFSLIVRVLLRKGKRLYINDGIWASLSDSWTGKMTMPARFIPDPTIRRRNGDPEKIVPFKVCGATCDSVDILTRPFYLPETIDTGDWIEIGNIGAYSLSLRSHFNGFYPDTFVEVENAFETGDAPTGRASVETMAD